jgi:hypothetical protein
MMFSKAPGTQDVTEMVHDKLSSSEKDHVGTLKTTKTGIPLVPQPSDDPEDPLVSTSSGSPHVLRECC